MLDDELASLLPIFIDETRERIEHLASALADLDADPKALTVVKRELHTVKGAARMMQFATLAELCHGAEDVLLLRGIEARPILQRVCDRLMELVDRVAATNEAPARQDDLMTELAAASVPTSAASAAVPEPVAEGVNQSPLPGAEGAEPAAVSRGHEVGDLRISPEALDALAERSTQVRLTALGLGRVVDRLRELGTLAEDGVREPQPAQVLAVLATMLRRAAGDLESGERQLARAGEDQLDTLLAVQLQPLRTHFQRFARHARELGRELGKDVAIELEGGATRLDRRVVRDLEDALLHLVRNAVDHGLESTEARRAAGKPAQGQVRLSARTRGARVEMRVEDDGRGVDAVAVRARAVALRLLDKSAADAMSEGDLQQLLFLPGFSTSSSVSQVSGRGIGLDIVAAAVARLGGEVRVESKLGAGTAIVLEVPLARRGERVFLLRVGRLQLALPAAVVRTVSVASADPHASENAARGGRVSVRIGDRLVSCVSLAAQFGQSEPQRPMVIEAQILNHTFAVTVDAIEGEEEVLMRAVPAAASSRLLEGLALLAAGHPVGVLSPVALAQHEGGVQLLPVLRVAPPPPRVHVLLVDDSRVTREMERRLLEDAGFVVAAASDGEEALRALGERHFDCVVTDIEMPGMDGFRLTRELRALPQFANLPVVVVSTRDRPEDRLQGMQAGADAYLTKQSLNGGELIEKVRRLAGR